jgi:type II secretory pathway component HofQ
MKLITLLLAIILAAPGLAQSGAPTPPEGATQTKSDKAESLVTIRAAGVDVRMVLQDLFGQAKRSFVVDPSVRFSVHMSLKDVTFNEALDLVCRHAELEFEIRNGIYFVTKAKPKSSASASGTTEPAVAQPSAQPAPRGRLPETVLQRRVTTRFTRVPLRDLVAELAKQAGVRIELDRGVPAYSLDAFLIDTSLKFALDVVTRAANLEYRFTENQSIVIEARRANRVQVVSGS